MACGDSPRYKEEFLSSLNKAYLRIIDKRFYKWRQIKSGLFIVLGELAAREFISWEE